MRADPPPPPREPKRDRGRGEGRSGFTFRSPKVRCPYLEQIVKGRAWFGLLTRFNADCHVDHRTHEFTGRHPVPPCTSDPTTCSFYHQARDDENRRIQRYTD